MIAADYEVSGLQAEIKALAKERNAVIIAHNYERPEVQDVADYVGDSLGLSREAAKTSADIIVFCGVHFMAETAAVLSPRKMVLLPDMAAGCSLAATIDGDQLDDIIAGVDLTNEPDIVTSILIDLAQRETKNNAARFAQVLLPELRGAGRIVAQTHKFAGFVVLKAPDVPSVLIENGYLSNPDDEEAMSNGRWRTDMASGIARGVDRYFALIRHGRTAGGTE